MKSTSPLDGDVDRAIALNIGICEQICEGAVSAKDAIHAFKRQLDSTTNTGAKVLALTLVDMCVRNGTEAFRSEVASSSFMDNFVSLLNTTDLTPYVRDTILRLIQSWKDVFDGNSDLDYVQKTYKLLQSEGYIFPMKDSDMTSANSDLGSALCSSCRNLDLSPNITSDLNLSHLSFSEASARPRCPLCRLVCKAAGTKFNSRGSDPITWNNERAFHWNKDGGRIVYIDDNVPSPDVGGRKVDSMVDTDLIKSWLQLCCDEHGWLCAHKEVMGDTPGQERLEVFRVIDVQDMCIVNAPDHCRYLALSYVWGGIPTAQLTAEKMPKLMTPGALHDDHVKLPKTISDAIELVKKIGERYLWVDNLCIVQDDLKDLRYGISVMDMLYEGSVLTIIAAQGPNANAGLPGVTDGKGREQPVEEVKPGTKMTVVEPLFTVLSESKYMTRGWTYQELLLSHRCLIFVNSRVYFLCRQRIFSEDTVYDLFPSTVNKNTGSSQGITLLKKDDPKPLATYSGLLFRYNARDLTVESDALNAMTGLLNQLTRHLQSDSLVGLPTICFDLSVLFRHQFNIQKKRRPGFPSWSWVGWNDYTTIWTPEEDGVEMQDWLKNSTHISWFFRDLESGKVKPITELTPEHKVRLKANRKQLLPSSSTNQELQTTPTDSLPWKDISRPGPILQFWTYSFAIPRLENSKRGYASIFGKQHILCGAIYLDDKSFHVDSRAKRHEAIILSKCPKCETLGTNWLPCELNRPSYWVMLISRVELGFVERAGLGIIHQDAVDILGKFTWEEVLLA